MSAPAPRGVAPSEHARALYQQAEEWIDVGDPIGMGRDLVEQALADSPGFVAAAVSLYALGGTVPAATIDALQDDGPALVGAGRRASASWARAADASARTPTRWSRPGSIAPSRSTSRRRGSRGRWPAPAAGDRAGALDDLVAYVAREPNPEHLAEARALRAGLGEGPAARRAERAPSHAQLSPQLLARIRLLEDRPEAALRALGGSCVAGLPAERLSAIGLVDEYADRRTDGARLLRAGRRPRRRRRRSARAAGAPRRAPPRRRAARRRSAPARRAADRATASPRRPGRSRGSRAAGGRQSAAALAGAERALALRGRTAPADADVWLPAAREPRAGSWSEARRAGERARRARAPARAALGGAALGARSRSCCWRAGAGEAGRSPPRSGGGRRLFPEVARAVGELRHDVLKHRAGVLGAVARSAGPAARRSRARSPNRARPRRWWPPIYERLEQAARGAGRSAAPARARAGLRRAGARSGARRAARPRGAPRRAADEELAAIDRRLRGAHADALDALLRLGPRTRLDAAALSRWIAAVEAATRRGGRRLDRARALAGRAAISTFPSSSTRCAAIFTNLLRNAAGRRRRRARGARSSCAPIASAT